MSQKNVLFFQFNNFILKVLSLRGLLAFVSDLQAVHAFLIKTLPFTKRVKHARTTRFKHPILDT